MQWVCYHAFAAQETGMPFVNGLWRLKIEGSWRVTPLAYRTRFPMLRRSASVLASDQLRAPMTSEVPLDFVEIIDCLPPNIDRKLGYFGDARYVTFHYEPRAEDVIWKDDRTFGIATGAWSAFADEIRPLADAYGVNV